MRRRSFSAWRATFSMRTRFQSTYEVHTDRAPRWILVRRLCTGVRARATRSPARAGPPPLVCTVKSRREVSSTALSSAYLRNLTRYHPSRRPSRSRREIAAALRGDRDLLEELQLVEDLAGAEGDAGQRLVAHGDRQVRFLSQQQVEPAQQGAPARQHDALVHDVGGQLGGRPLQARADRVDDGHDRLPQRLADLLVGDHDRLGY